MSAAPKKRRMVEVEAEALDRLAKAIIRNTEAVEQLRVELDHFKKDHTEEATKARDAAVGQVVADLERLKAQVLDERPPEEQVKDGSLYINVRRAKGLSKAAGQAFAARARLGRAAKRMGMTIDQWVAWCDRHSWNEPDRAPSGEEKAMAEGQGELFLHGPPDEVNAKLEQFEKRKAAPKKKAAKKKASKKKAARRTKQ